jgi:hypothetical protein
VNKRQEEANEQSNSQAVPIEFMHTPVFIVGSPRSGTTLMAGILGQHPEFFSPGETHYFEEIWPGRAEASGNIRRTELEAAASRLYKSLGEHRFVESQEMIESAFKLEELLFRMKTISYDYSGLYTAFIQLLTESFGVERIVDDTPRHVFHLHTIRDIFPQVKVIGMIRDPRDFLASYKGYWRVTGPSETGRIRSLYHPVVTSLYWRSSTNTLLNHAHNCCKDLIHIVRYEDLVTNPRDIVSEVCTFLGYEFSSSMLIIDSSNSTFDRNGTGIYSSSIGRWRHALEPHEIWIVQRINHDRLSELGYKFEEISTSIVKVLANLISAPFSLVGALWRNRNHVGRIGDYLVRRIKMVFLK